MKMRLTALAVRASLVFVIVSLAACGGDDSAPAAKASVVVPTAPPVPASAASAPVTAKSESAPIQASAPTPAPIPASAPAVASASVAASAPVPTSTPSVKIDVYGDDASMGIAGYNYGMPIFVKSAATDLQDLLQKQFSDTGITVANHSTGGRAASLMNLLDGMDGGGPPFAQRLTSTQSSIVIISYGLNDQHGGETASDFSGYLAQAIQTVRDAERTPVLEEPGPVCDDDHPQLARYVDAIDAAGKTYGVPVISQYQSILALADWRLHMDTTCLLPDASLNTFKATNEQAVIEPIIKSILEKQP